MNSILIALLLSLFAGTHNTTVTARGRVEYLQNGIMVRTYMVALWEAESAARRQLAAQLTTMQMDTAEIRSALDNAVITGQRIRIDTHVAEVDMQLMVRGR